VTNILFHQYIFFLQMKDPDHEKLRNIPAPGLGCDKKKRNNDDKRFTESDYVVPPKVPQLQIGSASMKSRTEAAPGREKEAEKAPIFELPKEIADPTKSPCVNVPDW
jgi:hypothetical protein